MKGLIVTAFLFSLVSLGLSTATYIQVGGVSQIKSRMEDLGLEIKDLREETATRLELMALLFEAIQAISRAEDLIRWEGQYGEAAACLATTEAIFARAERIATEAQRSRIQGVRSEVQEVMGRVLKGERSAAKKLQRLGIKLRLLRDNL